ncbi:MAG: class I SAM-dependent methyltransferase [Desulfovibrio sp.]|nr:class I SAM-dependent methyltransferase [Desulfovibrio sp.]
MSEDKKEVSKNFFCPLCDSKVQSFVPLGGPLVNEYAKRTPAPATGKSGETINRFVMELFAPKAFSCPVCGGMDRERLVAAYLLRRLGRNFKKPGFRLLEFAPRAAVGSFLKKHFVLRHETADMFMNGVTYKVNISCMSEIESETYNAWICLHVLEHVPSDHKALKELFRILKPGGFGILLVPISLSLPMTDEDPDTSITDRWRRFGQDDHIRLYAKADFMQRIKDAGFILYALDKEYFGTITLQLLGLPMTSVLYVAERPS